MQIASKLAKVKDVKKDAGYHSISPEETTLSQMEKEENSLTREELIDQNEDSLENTDEQNTDENQS